MTKATDLQPGESLGDALTHQHLPEMAAQWSDNNDHHQRAPQGTALWGGDHVALTSVGIDIGSSGTQVIFSRVHLRRHGEVLSRRYVVAACETLYESPVALTPYADGNRIHDRALGRIIDAAYNEACLEPCDVDTGAVILTGEALRRDNAEAIAEIVAEKGGDFVCAAAGHRMEAMLAAYGSRAVAWSGETGLRVLNIDIGGGTTKLALIEQGCVVATSAFQVGGRLVVVDADDVIIRLEPAGARLAQQIGMAWQPGQHVTRDALARLADWMADVVVQAVLNPQGNADIAEFFLTELLPERGPIAAMMLSGGVAEYVHGRESRDFGDLGPLFGSALAARVRVGALPWPMLPNPAPIRATALGASEYSIQLSDSALFITDAASLLPRRNLPVIAPDFACDAVIDPTALAEAIRRHMADFDLIDGESEFALALRWRGVPEYSRVAAMAEGIIRALPKNVAAQKPIFLVLDSNVARPLGEVLQRDMAVVSPLLVIGGVALWDFDYIDLGRIRQPTGTVPVTVKSLVFSADPHAPAIHRAA